MDQKAPPYLTDRMHLEIILDSRETVSTITSENPWSNVPISPARSNIHRFAVGLAVVTNYNRFRLSLASKTTWILNSSVVIGFSEITLIPAFQSFYNKTRDALNPSCHNQDHPVWS